MRLVDILVGEIVDQLAIDVGLNPRAFGHHAVVIPLAVFEGLVRRSLVVRHQPAATGGFTVHISRLGALAPTRFNLDLRPIHAARVVDGLAGPLFGLRADQVEILIHPQSVIHSLVEFADGSQIAQLGLPDMRLPIQYALTWPNHTPTPCERLSLAEVGTLEFERPDVDKFPALGLCFSAGRAGGTFPAALSAADDVAVAAFIAGEISFTDIPAIVAETLERYDGPSELTFDALKEVDVAAHRIARESVKRRRL